jgi:hypothetical protein
MMNLPKSMNFFDCRCCESGEASLDGLLATKFAANFQLFISLIDLGIYLSFLLPIPLTCNLGLFGMRFNQEGFQGHREWLVSIRLASRKFFT